MEEVIKKLKCMRCGHEWFPKKPTLPKYCAKCNTPYWDRQRQKDIKKTEVKK